MTNVTELELLETVKIYPAVSRVQKYKDQVEGQQKEYSLPVVIEGEEEYKVEIVLSKRGKDRYLV